MQDRIDETLRQAEAKLAELKASPQGEKLARWDERAGHAIAWVQAASWVGAGCIAAAMAGLAMAMVEGEYRIAAAAIGGAIVLLLMWRAWKTAARPRAVSEMIRDEAATRLAPARMALNVAQRMRGGE
jgi:arginine exporter protein ArgO